MNLVSRLKNEQRPLVCFDHGLGDFCNWLPVYKELLKQTGRRIEMGVRSKRQFHLIYPQVVLTDKMEGRAGYSFIYNIRYRETYGGIQKPYECAYNEIGLNEFVWEPYQFKGESQNTDSKRVGVNFFGITGSKGKSKFCPPKTAEKIWNEIKEAGYEPFEIYQRVNFINDYYRDGDVPDNFAYANEYNSLRFREPNLKTLYDEVKKCKYVLSTDSGTLYLALCILGINGVIGLENEKKISQYLPTEIMKIDVCNYEVKSAYKLLSEK